MVLLRFWVIVTVWWVILFGTSIFWNFLYIVVKSSMRRTTSTLENQRFPSGAGGNAKRRTHARTDSSNIISIGTPHRRRQQRPLPSFVSWLRHVVTKQWIDILHMCGADVHIDRGWRVSRVGIHPGELTNGHSYLGAPAVSCASSRVPNLDLSSAWPLVNDDALRHPYFCLFDMCTGSREWLVDK